MAAPTSAATAAAPVPVPPAATTTTTILRVKRRRDEPPSHRLPSTLLLSTESLLGGPNDNDQNGGSRRAKRSRRNSRQHDDDEEEVNLAGMLHRSTFLCANPNGGGGSNRELPQSFAGAARNGSVPSLAASATAGTTTKPTPATAAAGARFRRVPGGDLSALVLAGGGGDDASSSASSASVIRSKRVRVVDASICREETSDNDNNDDEEGDDRDSVKKKKKRPKLVLDIANVRDVSGTTANGNNISGVEFWEAVAAAAANDGTTTATATTNTSGNRIMDPVTRAVDSSLRCVFRHEKSVLQHLEYLQTDSLLLSASGQHQHQPQSQQQLKSAKKWLKILNHTCTGGGGATGTVLHAAAIFNDLDGARTAIELGIDTKIRDGDGNTALAVAQTVGSSSVVALLSSSHIANGWIGDRNNDEDDADNDDDDYVFDVYCLAGARESARERDDWDAWDESSNTTEKAAAESSSSRASADNRGEKYYRSNDSSRSSSEEECRVEIKGGVGYWNTAGELVLEADDKRIGANAGSNDDVSFTEADDHDSNDEGYEGNDYPEDEDGQYDDDDDDAAYMIGGAAYGDSSDEEGLALYGRSYRQDPIPASAASGWSNVWSTTQNPDDNNEDGGHNLSGFGISDPDIGDDDAEYGGPMGRVTYGETGLYGEGGACAYDPEQDYEE